MDYTLRWVLKPDGRRDPGSFWMRVEFWLRNRGFIIGERRPRIGRMHLRAAAFIGRRVYEY